MTLKLNGSSSGYTAIDAPASAGSNTLTLPTSNGSANQYLKNSGTAGTLEFATLASSKILQIKTLVSTARETNPGSWTTVFSQALTPTSSTSKIIVIVSAYLEIGSTSGMEIALYDGTIRKGYREERNMDDSGPVRRTFTAVWVAEGSYTANTAYTFSCQAQRNTGESNCKLGDTDSDWASSMVVLEVDAS